MKSKKKQKLAGDRQIRAPGRRRDYISRAHYCSHAKGEYLLLF